MQKNRAIYSKEMHVYMFSKVYERLAVLTGESACVKLSRLFWRNNSLNPRQKVLNISIDTRPPSLCTTHSPTCGSNENVPAPLQTHKWPSAVPFAAVYLPLLVAGADHTVCDSIPGTLQVLLLTARMLNNRNPGYPEFIRRPPRLMGPAPSSHWAVCPRGKVAGSSW